MQQGFGLNSISNSTASLIEHIIGDQDFVTRYLRENTKRLEIAYLTCKTELEKIDCNLLPCQGTLNCLVDCRSILKEQSFECEE